MAYLVPGLILEGKNSHGPVRYAITGLLYIIAGLVVGGLLLSLVDLYCLHDFFFQVRPENLKALFSFNLGDYERSARSWFEYATAGFIFVPFVLYLVTLPDKNTGNSTLMLRLAWGLPLVIISLLSLLLIKGRFQIEPRYFYLALPLLSLWAPEFLHRLRPAKQVFSAGENDNMSGRYGTKSIFISIFLYAFYLLLCGLIGQSALHNGWQPVKFYFVIFIPISLSIILLIKSLDGETQGSQFLIFLILVTMLIIPTLRNLHRLVTHQAELQSQYRFTPYQYFSSRLRGVETGQTIFISKKIHDEYNMLGRGRLSNQWMFNIFFNKILEEKNFFCSEDFLKALENRVDYILVTKDEITAMKDSISELLQNYHRIPGKHNKIFLLEYIRHNPTRVTDHRAGNLAS